MRVTGSLQVKRGIYQMMTRVIFDDGTVKQKSKSTGLRENRQNKAKANKMLTDYIRELERGVLEKPDRLFLEAMKAWLEHKKLELRQDTYEAYQWTFATYLEPYFRKMNLKLDQVTSKIVAKYVDDMLAKGQSASSVKKHLVLINGLYKYEMHYGDISFNPVAGIVVRDRKEDFEGAAYTPELAKKLLMAVKGDPIEPAVYLGLYLGLRRSEVAGLRWKDIDFENGIVHIRNTVVQFKTLSEQEKTKNPSSKRDLCLPEGLRNFLIQKFPGVDFSKNIYICQREDGSCFLPGYISHRFHKVLERSGLPMIRFHDLRHTAGSMLINEGQSILQVQNFLGHKKASTTLDIYSHVYLAGKKETAAKIDELLDISLDK